jgi:DNA primase
MTAAPLENADLATILAPRDFRPGASEYAAAGSAFLAATTPVDEAAAELAQAVGILVERPALEGPALAEATARFEQELSDEAYAEQQRLVKRKLEFDARLGKWPARGSGS